MTKKKKVHLVYLISCQLVFFIKQPAPSQMYNSLFPQNDAVTSKVLFYTIKMMSNYIPKYFGVKCFLLYYLKIENA